MTAEHRCRQSLRQDLGLAETGHDPQANEVLAVSVKKTLSKKIKLPFGNCSSRRISLLW